MRSSLGIDISDSFFYADKSLLVEGPEDRIYIGVLLNYFVNQELIKLNSDLLSIIDSGSISNMPAMVQILLDEKRPMFVLIDNDDKSIYNVLIKKEKKIDNKDVFIIKTISDVKVDAISIEDLLPESFYLESIKNYLEFLVKENSIKLKDSNTLMPILDTISQSKKYENISKVITKYYSTIEGEELDKKTPISKVGIAHEFEKIININQSLGNDEEQNVCFSLIELITKNLKLL